MANKPLPSQEVLRQLLDYDPETGALTWRSRPVEMFAKGKKRAPADTARLWNAKNAGQPAFTASDGLSLSGTIWGKSHRAHRVAWALHYGEWPQGNIDHINGNPMDNRISNLRVVSQQENMKNTSRPSHNNSGAMGVGWHRQRKKWRATIMVNGKQIHLGLFEKFEEAIGARKTAERRFGFHKNHGRTTAIPARPPRRYRCRNTAPA